MEGVRINSSAISPGVEKAARLKEDHFKKSRRPALLD
jgi:hypothetical protein